MISTVTVLHTIRLAIERNENIKIVFEKAFKDDIKGSICFILHDYDQEFILSEKFGRILKNKKY